MLLRNGEGDISLHFLFISFNNLFCVACLAYRCTNIQRRAASPSIDVYISFEQTIETLRDRLQQSDFELCRVSILTLHIPYSLYPVAASFYLPSAVGMLGERGRQHFVHNF